MVREKDAAKKHKQALVDMIEESQRQLDANTIDFRWVVVEHTPAYNTGGYYDEDIPAKDVVVAGDFFNEKTAQEWIDKHEPDEGNTLIIKRKRLIKREITEWVWY